MPLLVKASPNEFLVVGSRGKLANRRLAGSARLWPGSSIARVASSEQEATFAMTQETCDGIPLRFEGIVLYRVVDPAAAAVLFDFTGGDGHAAIQELMAHVCLGELRDAVAHMTIDACIEQRKTTLTQILERELHARAARDGAAGWGVEVDVVQLHLAEETSARARQEETEARNPVHLRRVEGVEPIIDYLTANHAASRGSRRS